MYDMMGECKPHANKPCTPEGLFFCLRKAKIKTAVRLRDQPLMRKRGLRISPYFRGNIQVVFNMD
jgi:hypothetical protein